MEYGVLKLGSLVLRPIGSKKVKSTGLPGVGGVNGNLLPMEGGPTFRGSQMAPGVVGPLQILLKGLANCGLPPASPIPSEFTPNGGAPRFCSAVSSSKRLK